MSTAEQEQSPSPSPSRLVVWPPDLPLPALLLAMDSALARQEAGWATEPPPEVDFADWLESVCGWRSKA